MRRTTGPFVIATLAAFGALGAHTSGPPAAIPVLTPGSSDITTSRFRDEAVDYRSFLRAMPDSGERATALGRSEVHLTEYGGKPAMLLVSSSRPLQGTSLFIDSALVMRDGLAPVWESAHSARWNRRWEYSGKRVRVAVLDSGAMVREHTYDLPVFQFNELGALFRSLPLREGYEAILPVYSEGSDELEMDTVRVMARDAAGVWSIRFADPAVVATYGIDDGTRQIARYDVTSRTSPVRTWRVYQKSTR